MDEQKALEILATGTYDSLNQINLTDGIAVDHLNV